MPSFSEKQIVTVARWTARIIGTLLLLPIAAFAAFAAFGQASDDADKTSRTRPVRRKTPDLCGANEKSFGEQVVTCLDYTTAPEV